MNGMQIIVLGDNEFLGFFDFFFVKHDLYLIPGVLGYNIPCTYILSFLLSMTHVFDTEEKHNKVSYVCVCLCVIKTKHE